MTPNGNFVAYYRVSTGKQGESGLGLEAQRKQVEEFVSNRGGEIVAEYEEIESGTNGARPKLEEALERAEAYGGTLVVAKLDRLARDAGLIHKLRNQDVDIEFANLPGANGLTIGVLAAVAEHEARMISERTSAAIKEMVARGEWHSRPENLDGHREKGAEKAAAERTKKADQRARRLAPILQEIEEEGSTSLRDKAKALEDRGVPTPRGGSWSAMAVSRLEDRIEGLESEG